MQTIENILSAYNLNESEVQRVANEAKVASIGCGTGEIGKQLPSSAWTLLDEISDEVWYSKMEVTHKIFLGFQLYEMFPSYYHFLVPFYHRIRDKEIYLMEHKKIIWEKFIWYLASDACYADPVGYILWVEFFEDTTTVSDMWQGLLNNCHDKKSLRAMLEVAGPVPFDLKENCYKELISDKGNHETIFNSLLHSAFDIYGKIDKRKASIILAKLNVDTASEKYKLLEDKLKI